MKEEARKAESLKETALKLADDLEELHEQDLIDGVAHLSMPQASAMIRRLVEELDKLGKGDYIEGWEEGYQACKNDKQCEPDYFILTQDHTWLSCDEDFYNKAKPTHRMKCYTTPQTKPLSDEEIEKTCVEVLPMLELFLLVPEYGWIKRICRAIEERHGIK